MNSYPIFTGRWGYREEFSLIYRLRVLRPRPLRRRLRLPPGFTVEEVGGFDGSADELWEEVSLDYRVAQVRDAAYLNWRYVANPDHYDLLDASAARPTGGDRGAGKDAPPRHSGGGTDGDSSTTVNDEDTLRLLVGAADVVGGTGGCRLLQAWSVPDTRLDARLRRAGLRWRRGEIKFLLSPGFPGGAASDPEAWLVSQGTGTTCRRAGERRGRPTWTISGEITEG